MADDTIFPFMDPQAMPEEETAEAKPLAREWAWDFNKLDFKTKDGKMYMEEGKEAVKIWIWKILMAPRYRYPIFNWDYGNELDNLIGVSYSKEYVQSEAERMIREAIWPTLDGYVTDIQNLKVGTEKDILKISFTAVTPYGEVGVNA
jgi:hypothetical protein